MEVINVFIRLFFEKGSDWQEERQEEESEQAGPDSEERLGMRVLERLGGWMQERCDEIDPREKELEEVGVRENNWKWGK